MNLKSKALLAVLIIGLLLLAEKKFQFASQTRAETERIEYQEEMQRLEKTQEMNKKAHPDSNEARTTQQSPKQSASGYEMRSDGKLHDVEPCSLCEGTGIERNHNRNSLNPEAGRICPQCGGSGHQSY